MSGFIEHSKMYAARRNKDVRKKDREHCTYIVVERVEEAAGEVAEEAKDGFGIQRQHKEGRRV